MPDVAGRQRRAGRLTEQPVSATDVAIPSLRSTIVLVHGLLGFDQLRVSGRRVKSYFPGIVERLRAAGNRVLTARVSPTGGVAQRAADLKTFLDREAPGEPVHLIAHSMGGLDSRYLISKLDGAGRVLSLTTVGTPHRGSAFADWGVRRLERCLMPVFHWLGLPHQAFYDLTTAGCAKFNQDVPDAPGVRYFSVAGRCLGPWLGLGWQLPYRIVNRAEGENDGIVSVASATYGESCEVWDGDHLNLVNWPNLGACVRGLWRDRSLHYGGLVRRLADEGF
jgi:triacylglycerol lipase